MDTKSLSRYVCLAQKLSWYHFQIDSYQEKVSATVDVLLRFLQRRQTKEKMLRNENTQIFYCLQTSLTRASLSGLSLMGHVFDLLPLY